MEARDGARRVTQRQLEAPEEAPSEPRAPIAPEPLPPAEVPAPRPPISREPSDLALRERQARWLRERARFEAVERTSAPSTEAPK